MCSISNVDLYDNPPPSNGYLNVFVDSNELGQKVMEQMLKHFQVYSSKVKYSSLDEPKAYRGVVNLTGRNFLIDICDNLSLYEGILRSNSQLTANFNLFLTTGTNNEYNTALEYGDIVALKNENQEVACQDSFAARLDEDVVKILQILERGPCSIQDVREHITAGTHDGNEAWLHTLNKTFNPLKGVYWQQEGRNCFTTDEGRKALHNQAKNAKVFVANKKVAQTFGSSHMKNAMSLYECKDISSIVLSVIKPDSDKILYLDSAAEMLARLVVGIAKDINKQF